MRPIGPGPSNHFENGEWGSDYERRSLFRKVLTFMKDRIVLESYVLATCISIPITVGVVAIPVVGLF